jgi:hypothetical protein
MNSERKTRHEDTNSLKLRRMCRPTRVFTPEAICGGTELLKYFNNKKEFRRTRNGVIDKDEHNSERYPFEPHQYTM